MTERIKAMSDPDMDGVIAGLTKAQRRMLSRHWWPVSPLIADWRTFPALQRRGLVDRNPMFAKLTLTTLGQQVRARLLSQQANSRGEKK